MPRRSPRLAPAPVAIRGDHSEGRFQIRDSATPVRGRGGVAAPVARGSAPPPAILPRHAQVARLIVNNNPETMKPPRRTAPTTTGWIPPSQGTRSQACAGCVHLPALPRGVTRCLCKAGITASRFVRTAPTDANEFVVRARRSLRDQAIALGLDVGGRIARVLPDEKHPPLAGVRFLELVQAVRRRQRRLRHGSTPFLGILVMRRHRSASCRARGCLRAWRGAPRSRASPAPARRYRPRSPGRRPPTA